MLERIWRKWNAYTLLMRMQVGVASLENSMEASQKANNIRIVWSRNSTPGYISKKKNENTNLKKYMHPKFIAVLFPIAKIWKKPKCP